MCLNIKQTNKFADVKSSEWFMPYVAWASEKGIANGIGNDKFNPNGIVTKEQMCVMLLEFAKDNNCELGIENNVDSCMDKDKISLWAIDAVTILKKSGIVTDNSENLFEPQKNMTKIEVANILFKLIK